MHIHPAVGSMALVAGLGLGGVSQMSAAEMGTVTGTIRVERAKVLTEGPKSYRDVIVSLDPLAEKTFPPPVREVEMDQRGLLFIPHVMAAQIGQPVTFLNSDNDRHNVYFLFEKTGETLDIGTWGPGQKVTHKFTEAGEVITLCQLHLEMAAYILVFDHPYHTVGEIKRETQTATYRLGEVPAGQYRLRVWHKKLLLKGKPATVTVKPGQSVTADAVITKRQYAKRK